MSPMRAASVAGLMFGAMMGIAIVVALLATVPVELTAPPAMLIGPGQPVSAVRASAIRDETSVVIAIDPDTEPDFGTRHTEAVGDGFWLHPGTLNIAAPDMLRLHQIIDRLRPQMPRPATTKTERDRTKSRRPPLRMKAAAIRSRPTALDPGPSASGPRWPTYLVRVRGDHPPDWRKTVFGER